MTTDIWLSYAEMKKIAVTLEHLWITRWSIPIFAPGQNCSGFELNPESTGDASTIQYAYLIVGLFTMLVASVFVILQCCGRTCKSTTISSKPKNRRDSIGFTSFRQVFSPKDWADGDACYGTMIFIFMNLYFVFELATIKGTQEYLVTYAVDSGHFRSKEAVALNSVLFATGLSNFITHVIYKE